VPGPELLARKPGTVNRVAGDKTLVMIPEKRTLHVLNESAGAVWAFLSEPRAEEAVVDELTRVFDCPRETAARDVKEVLAKLDSLGLLVRKPGA